MPKIRVGNKYLAGFETEPSNGGLISNNGTHKVTPIYANTKIELSSLSVSNKISCLIELMRFEDIKKENITIEW